MPSIPRCPTCGGRNKRERFEIKRFFCCPQCEKAFRHAHGHSLVNVVKDLISGRVGERLGKGVGNLKKRGAFNKLPRTALESIVDAMAYHEIADFKGHEAWLLNEPPRYRQVHDNGTTVIEEPYPPPALPPTKAYDIIKRQVRLSKAKAPVDRMPYPWPKDGSILTLARAIDEARKKGTTLQELDPDTFHNPGG
jgi:hypothetical protein